VVATFGFLLYVTKLLSFPDAPMTQAFYYLWRGGPSVNEQGVEMDMRVDQPSPDMEAMPITELSHQGVNVFTLHFSYLSELFLESIDQMVIQILIASLGAGWSFNAIFSLVFSATMILLYLCRYAYWVLIRPCCRGVSFRQSFIDMHMYYYHIPDEQDLPPPSRQNAGSSEDGQTELLEFPIRDSAAI